MCPYWTQAQGPKKSARILPHVLKNTESNADLKGLDVDYLARAHPGEQNPQDAKQNLLGSTPEPSLPHGDNLGGKGAGCS